MISFGGTPLLVPYEFVMRLPRSGEQLRVRFAVTLGPKPATPCARLLSCLGYPASDERNVPVAPATRTMETTLREFYAPFMLSHPTSGFIHPNGRPSFYPAAVMYWQNTITHTPPFGLQDRSHAGFRFEFLWSG